MNLAMSVPGMLAEVPKLPTPVDSLDRQALSGMMPVVLVVLAVLAALMIWAVFLRRGPRNPRARVLSDDPARSGHRRRRHKRREHRPSNPTLAETGGLPPVKNAPDRDEEA